MPDDTSEITARDAIGFAVNAMLNGRDHESARSWAHIAAELRQQATTPVLDRILGQVRNQLPPEDPTKRLTLHDIEAHLCNANERAARIVIRNRHIGGWWMHTDDHSMCTD